MPYGLSAGSETNRTPFAFRSSYVARQSAVLNTPAPEHTLCHDGSELIGGGLILLATALSKVEWIEPLAGSDAENFLPNCSDTDQPRGSGFQ